MKKGILLFLVAGLQLFSVSCFREKVNPRLKDVIQYGLEKTNFYKVCLEQRPAFRMTGGDLNINVQMCKNDFNEQTYFITFDKLEGLNFSIYQTKAGDYLFSGCVSKDDIKLVTARPTDCGEIKKYKAAVNAVNDENFLKYFDRNSEAVQNLKKQLVMFVDDGGERNFYIAPFGQVDSEVMVYWKEKNEFIFVSRPPQDLGLKKINFAQTKNYEPVNQEQIDKAVKYGVAVTIP